MKDDDKKILHSTVLKHMPWTNKAIKHLRGMGKIGSQFEDGDFYNTGYNAIAEALSSYNKDEGSFKTHAQGILKYRILRHIEKEMARSGGGGVDPHFLHHAREEQKKRQQKEADMVPKPITTEPSAADTPPAIPTIDKPKIED